MSLTSGGACGSGGRVIRRLRIRVIQAGGAGEARGEGGLARGDPQGRWQSQTQTGARAPGAIRRDIRPASPGTGSVFYVQQRLRARSVSGGTRTAGDEAEQPGDKGCSHLYPGLKGWGHSWEGWCPLSGGRRLSVCRNARRLK